MFDLTQKSKYARKVLAPVMIAMQGAGIAPTANAAPEWHPGTLCRETNLPEEMPKTFTNSRGIVNNSSVSSVLVTCPVINDDHASPYELQGAAVVLSKANRERTLCILSSRDVLGGIFRVQFGENFSGPAPGAARALPALLIFPTVRDFSGTTYSIDCFIPPAEGTNKNELMSYMVDEG